MDDDAELNRILIQLGTEEVRLRNLQDGKELSEKQLSEILELLEALDKYANGLRRKGGDFAVYLEHRHPTTHELPQHLVRIRQGNEESVHYFLDRENLAEFGAENPDLDLGLSGEEESDTSLIEKAKNGSTRRARHEEFYESHVIKELLDKLARKGLALAWSTIQRRTTHCLN